MLCAQDTYTCLRRVLQGASLWHRPTQNHRFRASSPRCVHTAIRIRHFTLNCIRTDALVCVQLPFSTSTACDNKLALHDQFLLLSRSSAVPDQVCARCPCSVARAYLSRAHRRSSWRLFPRLTAPSCTPYRSQSPPHGLHQLGTYAQAASLASGERSLKLQLLSSFSAVICNR